MIIAWFTQCLRSAAACLFVFAVLGLSHVYAATVKPGITLQSDQETIYLGDSVVIDVEAVGLLEPLDVSPLFRDADLLRETTGTRIAVINGRVVEVKLRRMEFLPRAIGSAFFGPLSGEHMNGESVSNSLIIKVLPAADTNWQPTEDDHQLSLSVSSKTPYVGQRVSLDIVLKHRHPVTDEEISLPDFAGFDVLPVFESRRTIDDETGLDGEPSSWRVIAWRYYLFPQRSGTVTLADVNWRGTMIRSRTQRGNFELSEVFPTIQVQAAVSNEDWWLPASNVNLTDSWSTDVRELSAGDETMRTITLTAQDVLANHLPSIKPLPSRAINSTLINQSREHKLIGEVVTATATFEFRMTAQSPIPVFLDTVRVPWWDTSSNTPQESIIPARRINVGLPDRADLLSDVALAEEPIARVLLTLQSSGRRSSIWHWVLGLLSILATWLLWREVRWHWSHYNASKQARLRGKEVSVFAEL